MKLMMKWESKVKMREKEEMMMMKIIFNKIAVMAVAAILCSLNLINSSIFWIQKN
jgi:hypothetical protein